MSTKSNYNNYINWSKFRGIFPFDYHSIVSWSFFKIITIIFCTMDKLLLESSFERVVFLKKNVIIFVITRYYCFFDTADKSLNLMETVLKH